MICSFTLICVCCCHMLMAVLNMMHVNVSYTGAKRGAVQVNCSAATVSKNRNRKSEIDPTAPT